MIVPRVLTPFACADLPAALDAGHHRARGFGLSADSYAIAGAQLELEHGRRVVSAADVAGHPPAAPLLGCEVLWGCFGYNLGNHDATSADRADPAVPIFQTVPEGEVGPGGRYTAQHWRVASPDLASGAERFWRGLLDGFSDAYDALVAGDVPGFVHALKEHGYFTASEAQYDRIEEALVGAWRARVAAQMG